MFAGMLFDHSNYDLPEIHCRHRQDRLFRNVDHRERPVYCIADQRLVSRLILSSAMIRVGDLITRVYVYIRLHGRNCFHCTLKVIDRFEIKRPAFCSGTRARVIYIDGQCCVLTILWPKSFTQHGPVSVPELHKFCN